MLLFLVTLGGCLLCLGLLLWRRRLSLAALCVTLLGFGLLDLVLMAAEVAENQDSYSEEADTADTTQRIMFLAAGVIMVLAAPLLYLLYH